MPNCRNGITKRVGSLTCADVTQYQALRPLHFSPPPRRRGCHSLSARTNVQMKNQTRPGPGQRPTGTTPRTGVDRFYHQPGPLSSETSGGLLELHATRGKSGQAGPAHNRPRTHPDALRMS